MWEGSKAGSWVLQRRKRQEYMCVVCVVEKEAKEYIYGMRQARDKAGTGRARCKGER